MGISSQGRTLKLKKKNRDKTILIDTSCTECTIGLAGKKTSVDQFLKSKAKES